VPQLGWQSLGQSTLPAFNVGSQPRNFKVQPYVWPVGPAQPGGPPLPRVVPSGLIRCENMSGVATPHTGEACIFSGFTPEIVFSRNDPLVNVVAWHMYDAIHAYDHPNALRRDSSRREANRIAAGCTRNGQWQPKKPNWNCDEYPFAATVQGGAGASIRGVPESQNSRQGGKLSYFFVNHHVLDHSGSRLGDVFKVKVK
jgi:hypothetical protein